MTNYRKNNTKRKTCYDKYSGKLWDKTHTDWNVEVSHTLTEPVCAYVTLYSDDPNLPRLDNFIGCYDVNESISLACDHMLKLLKNNA